MNKNIYILSMLFIVGLSACNDKGNEDIVIDDNNREITAGNYNISFKGDFEHPSSMIDLDSSSLQKMKFVDDNYHVSFEESDVISVWGESGYCAKGTIAAINDDNKIDIEVSIKSEDKDGAFYALIPSSASPNDGAVSNGVITAEIPSTQYAVNRTCDSRAFIVCAYSGENAQSFHFKNATSMLRIETGKPYKSVTIESLSGQLAGKIGIQMSGESVSDITLKDNSEKIITLVSSDDGMIAPGVYYIAVAPSAVQHTLLVTLREDEQNYSVARYSKVVFRKSNVSKISFANLVKTPLCWYKVMRDGQLGVDIGMRLDEKRVYWSPYDFGATEVGKNGILYGWGNHADQYGESYSSINDMSNFYDPANVNGSHWEVASVKYFKFLLEHSDFSYVAEPVTVGGKSYNRPQYYILKFRTSGRSLVFPCSRIGYQGEKKQLQEDLWCAYYWLKDGDESDSELKGKIVRIGLYDDEATECDYNLFSSMDDPNLLTRDFLLEGNILPVYKVGLPYRAIYVE